MSYTGLGRSGRTSELYPTYSNSLLARPLDHRQIDGVKQKLKTVIILRHSPYWKEFTQCLKMRDTTTTTTTTVLRPLYRSTYISWHLQLRNLLVPTFTVCVPLLTAMSSSGKAGLTAFHNLCCSMFSRTCWASAETPCRRPWCRQQSVWNVDRGAWLHCRQPACCCQPTAHPTTARRRLDHVGQTPARTAARPGLENASDQSRSGHTWLLNISTITRYTTERAFCQAYYVYTGWQLRNFNASWLSPPSCG